MTNYRPIFINLFLVALSFSQASVIAQQIPQSQPATATGGTKIDSAASDELRCTKSLKGGDYQQALAVCQTELAEIKQTDKSNLKKSRQTMQLLLDLAEVHHFLGNTAQETNLLKEVEKHPQFNGEREIKYRWLRKMGQFRYFEKDYRNAFNYLNQGLELAKQSDNQMDLAKSYNDLGLVQSQLGDFKQALAYYQQSLKIKQAIGDRYKIATTLNNVGLIHIKLEKLEQGVHYYEQALEEFLLYTTEAEFDHRVFSNINHLYEDLAVAYSQLGKAEKAAEYRVKTHHSIEQKSSEWEKARAYINLASLWLTAYSSEKNGSQNNLERAYALLEKASALQKEGNFDLRMELDSQKAVYYHLKGNNEKAITFANSSLMSAEQKRDFLVQAKMLLILSRSYQTQAPQTALKYMQDYADTREKFIAQKYDTELRSIQIEIEKGRVEKALAEEKIANIENQSAIQRLTNWILSIVILLLLFLGLIVYLAFKKQREKQALLQSLKFHQQQLLLLQGKYSDDTNTEGSDLSEQDDDESEEETPIEPQSTLQLKQRLRESLVKTMVNAVSIWESHTGTNRVELAEKSRIWTVSVDNGTLRTRSLDKYLSLKKIPHNPRWRNVVGTCHFILTDAEIPASQRKKLNADLDELMSAVKSLSLNGPAD